MAKKRTARKQRPDVTGCEILITPKSGEVSTTTIAKYIRTRAHHLIKAIDHLLSGDEVEVSADDGTYTIKLVLDNKTAHRGRFGTSGEHPQARTLTEAALSSEPVAELKAVG